MHTTLTETRDTRLHAFDEAWSETHKRPRASFEGVRQTFFEEGFRTAMDAITSGREDLACLTTERDALEEHVKVEGDCRQQMFLGNCADCDQYHRLTDRIIALENPVSV